MNCPPRSRSRCRAREAAIGTAGAAKPDDAFRLAHRMRRSGEDSVLDRSLRQRLHRAVSMVELPSTIP
ncbi:hypothetical protein EMIT051CA3_40635 [Pseudomonas chlororaphis]